MGGGVRSGNGMGMCLLIYLRFIWFPHGFLVSTVGKTLYNYLWYWCIEVWTLWYEEPPGNGFGVDWMFCMLPVCTGEV